MEQLAGAVLAMAIGVAACALYYFAANLILDLIFPFRGGGARAVRNQKIAASIRPWLFLGPAILILALYLAYPLVDSIRLSFFDKGGENFVGGKDAQTVAQEIQTSWDAIK